MSHLDWAHKTTDISKHFFNLKSFKYILFLTEFFFFLFFKDFQPK